MRRREFITLFGGAGAAVAWPIVARAQQPALPVIGFVNSSSPQGYAQQVAAFVQGLGEVGYVEGRNVAIEYRWAEGKADRLPALVADLVHRQVAVIAATTTLAALAAKAAATTIPIVFELGGDPIELGLVASLDRPGGNLTGVTQLNQLVAPKRLELLHELIPTARLIALLVDPSDSAIAKANIRDVQAAARSLGLELHVLNASTEGEFNGVFAKLAQLQASGLVIGNGPYFVARTRQFAELAVRYAVPTVFESREFVGAGGLISYGASLKDSYNLTGVYAGRILKGEKPADLPVQQATKVEFYINLKTAKALGLNVPNTLIGRADEVIE
jgi:putative tryptophan/tyrosine transport system substrate-binding protein